MTSGGGNRRETASPGGKDDKLALALAQGMTRSEAALHAGMGERTVYTKLRDPGFLALVNRLRDRLISEAVGKLAASGGPAVARLNQLMASDDERIGFQSANAILSALVKLGGYHDLAVRVAELESRVETSGTGRPIDHRADGDLPGDRQGREIDR